MTTFERELREVRAGGRVALVPYIMGGTSSRWTQYLEAMVAGGADAIEIGIPFSDPMMDGVVIQEAAVTSLANGTTVDTVLDDVASQRLAVPYAVMTYYNIFHHYGARRMAGRLHDAGVGGVIVPDLTFEESGEWRACADEADIATVVMVAPSTPPARLAMLAGAAQGFVYVAARMAVTGVAHDAGDAERIVADTRTLTDAPLYVGIGIASPEQASGVAAFADGVIVGSALSLT